MCLCVSVSVCVWGGGGGGAEFPCFMCNKQKRRVILLLSREYRIPTTNLSLLEEQQKALNMDTTLTTKHI